MSQHAPEPWVLEAPHHGVPIAPTPLERWPTLSDLVHIACDIQPDIGDEAPGVALGPWSDVMDVTRASHKQLLRTAVALCGLSCTDSEPTSPLRRFLNNGAHKKHNSRPALSSVLRTPMGLWRITKADGQRWRVRDLLDLEHVWTPSGAVDLRTLASVASQPLDVGDTVCARLLPTPDGHVAVVGFYVKGSPDTETLESWRALVLTRHHKERPNGSIGAAVSRYGHLLAQRLHLWAWHDG